MNKETCMKEAEESILHTYNRFPVVFDHGEGVYLYDTDGKEYLDFAESPCRHLGIITGSTARR